MKTCTKCKLEQPKKDFYKCKSKKDGLHSNCKSCTRLSDSVRSEALREYRKVYYLENKESISSRIREYRQANPEKIAERWRKYHLSNPEKACERSRRWASENPEKCAEKCRNRRAMKMASEGSHTTENVKDIFKSQRGFCANCEEKLFKSGENRYHIDHIMPLSKGGSNDKYNLQLLCPTCNLRKHAKDPFAWANENGRLL